MIGKGSVVESDSGSGDRSESGSGIESASGSGVESASGSTSGSIDGMLHVAIKNGNGGIDIIALYAQVQIFPIFSIHLVKTLVTLACYQLMMVAPRKYFLMCQWFSMVEVNTVPM